MFQLTQVIKSLNYINRLSSNLPHPVSILFFSPASFNFHPILWWMYCFVFIGEKNNFLFCFVGKIRNIYKIRSQFTLEFSHFYGSFILSEKYIRLCFKRNNHLAESLCDAMPFTCLCAYCEWHKIADIDAASNEPFFFLRSITKRKHVSIHKNAETSTCTNVYSIQSLVNTFAIS